MADVIRFVPPAAGTATDVADMLLAVNVPVPASVRTDETPLLLMSGVVPVK
jgi:hypothetical protein